MKNGHLGEICGNMPHAKNIPGHLWAEYMKTTSHVINRLPQLKLEFMSPFQKLWKLKPTVNYFRVFCCVCYDFVPDHLHSKFERRRFGASL